MAPTLRFGVEIETEAEPLRNKHFPAQEHYRIFADKLKYDYSLDAVAGTTKSPSSYDKWWITNDSSISNVPNVTSKFLSLSDYRRLSAARRPLMCPSSQNGICIPNSIYG
jgi:hypothetical protein